MHQAIHQRLIVIYAISLGLLTAFVPLLQPIPSVFAQQLIGSVDKKTVGADIEVRHIENKGAVLQYPTKSLKKKAAQIPTHRPHRLAVADTSNSSSPRRGGDGGRTMRRLSSEISDLTQLVSPTPTARLSNKPAIGINSFSLSFTAQQGGSNPTAQLLSISNTGGGTLNWRAHNNASWLSLSPASGTDTGLVTASVATGTLTVGTYSGSIIVNATGAASVTVPVTFTVTPAPPALNLSPTSLAFTAQQGGSNPAAQTLAITNKGGGTLTWAASDNTAWISPSPASGTGNGVATITVSTGSLAAGTYNGAVTLNATGAASVTVPVTFTVTPAPPALNLSPTSLAFTATQGGANPATQTLSISNTGGGTLNWSASDNAAWLTLSSSTGTGNGTVTLSVTTGTLTPATYSGTVMLSGGTGVTPVSVPVSFTVAAAPVPPAIGTSPTSLSFTAQEGGSNPVAQALTISNTGGGTLSWSVSHDATWLWHTPGTGTGTGTVTISVISGSLTAGTHSGRVIIWPTGSTATPITVPVTFTVAAAPVPPAIGMSPTSLSFTAQEGGSNPPAQTLAITNKGGGTLTWAASDNTAWISPFPASGTGNGVATITVSTGFLKAGTYNGAVTLSATGATPVTVPVTFIVTPIASTATTTVNVSPSSLNYAATQGAANPANQTISLTNTGGVLNWTVSDDASWLAVSPTSGSGSSTLTTSVNTAGLTAQTYNGIITVGAAGFSSRTITVTLTLSAPATSSATLTWNTNTANDLAGYKIYRAETSGGYGAPIVTLQGNVTTYMATGLQVGKTYFFVITAYDLSGNESLHSNEVSKSIF
jgi:hypothetical protein